MKCEITVFDIERDERARTLVTRNEYHAHWRYSARMLKCMMINNFCSQIKQCHRSIVHNYLKKLRCITMLN